MNSALKGPGHVTVNKRFVQDSLRVRGIFLQIAVSYKMADRET